MRIVRAGLRAFSLPLRAPLGTAHGPIACRDGFYVSLEDEAGQIGLGEATPLPAFGTEDHATCRLALEAALERLVDARELGLDEALAVVQAALQAGTGAAPKAAGGVEVPCARAALDTALHDLEARQAGCSLAARVRVQAGLAGEVASSVRVQALVGGGTPDEVAARALAAQRSGFSAFKLKLAVTSERREVGPDLDRVAALRAAVGPQARLRLDANEAWSRREAAQALDALAAFDIDFVEQPVARTDLAGLAKLAADGAVPVAADEALLGTGLEAVLAARAASIFVLKPSALGGLAASRSLWQRARADSIRIVWSSLIDGVVARAAALALAAGLAEDGEGEVHGLGTATLLAADLVPSPAPDAELHRDGAIALSRRPGLGCELAPAWDVEGEVFGAALVWESGR